MEAIKKKKNMSEKEREKRAIYILSLSNVIQLAISKNQIKKEKGTTQKR